MIWWLPHILLIAWNIANSQIDAYRILKHKNIAHGVNFGAYAVVVGVLTWINHNYWILPLSAFFNRQITFDIPLNVRRKLDWFYQSTAIIPKAVMDRIERFVFRGKKYVPEIAYGTCWVATLILDYFI